MTHNLKARPNGLAFFNPQIVPQLKIVEKM